MRYITFAEKEHPTYDICILTQTLQPEPMRVEYVHGRLDPDRVFALDLFKRGKRTPVSEQREYLEHHVYPQLAALQTKYVICADGDYFKTLTGAKKIVPSLGYVLDAVQGDFKVVYCPTIKQIFYNPRKTRQDIERAIGALIAHDEGNYMAPGSEIIKTAYYPTTYDDIKMWLDKLIEMDVPLTADIEAFSLKHYDAGIGTITFCWNEHEGIAFPVDYEPILNAQQAPYGRKVVNEPVRKLLKDFFMKFQNKLIWHGITYDVYVLVYTLFMDTLVDTGGLLTGLEFMLQNWDCSMLITYLATNSCSGNVLGLKENSQEFSGNYAVDVKDITKVRQDYLLRYNLIDGLSTWFVYNKHYPTMVAANQLNVYETLFKDSVVDIIQMQLTGLPIDRNEVLKVQAELTADRDGAVDRMRNSTIIQAFEHQLKTAEVIKRNAEYKTKVITIDEAKVVFNPNSNPQLQKLLYGDDALRLPIIEVTANKNPATGKDVLKALRSHTNEQEIIDLLNALIDFADVDIILNTFVPAFLEAPMAEDGGYYLFGNFKLGGTLSGRLSSSNPNLQNIPSSGTKYAKAIKRCFRAMPGWLFGGLDFASLEDRISALTTKDPMKLKVYTDGYDGHCLRAYYYFEDQITGIDPNDVKSINSIKKLYPHFRQDSKAPTFALTYRGTYKTLMKNCGFSEELALRIETNYHHLYKVSDDWVNDRLAKASQLGYVEIAFGMRLRTPLLHQTILGTSKTPYEAEAEGRTAANALGQSWCILNNRAASEFMKKVRASKFRLVIRPCAHIHDAQYFLFPNDPEVVEFINTHLVIAAQWQDHPDIYHPDVKLGGELSIFYPTWAEELELPNGASQEQILALSMDHIKKVNAK